jgi:acyl-CoA synthetase (NDP forming)
VLLLYLEQIDDDAALRCALDSARESGIAVAAVIAGTSSHGRRSASLHTGSAGIDGARAADLFRGCGCRLAPSLPELCDSVPLYLSEYAHALPSNGIAIVSNSGASCVLACDVAERLGLPIATLSEASRSALDALLPSFSLNRNPVDLTAMLLTDPGLLGRAIEVVLADPAVDMAALGLLAIGGPSYDVPRFARECAAAARRFGKPCVVHSPDERVRTMFVREGCAVFGCEQAAMEALRDLRVHIKTYPTGRANLHAVI